eukprot:Blabericola_migrator_1__8211@NODE_424_length_8630_cov_20_263342_g335_i0_p6_GENE_NODE_424_length_8630_cov_20_263342_g335_i0NODE_424_length_8630_cov_20_263342_g335_i0_p6_ORF_typecomplete_len103_score1_44_NODE_424_length_8630_cov_20_263342_g335_i011681476
MQESERWPTVDITTKSKALHWFERVIRNAQGRWWVRNTHKVERSDGRKASTAIRVSSRWRFHLSPFLRPKRHMRPATSPPARHQSSFKSEMEHHHHFPVNHS